MAYVVVSKRLWRTIVQPTPEVLIRALVIDRGVRDCSSGALCMSRMYFACVSMWAHCVDVTFVHKSVSLHMVRREVGVGLA